MRQRLVRILRSFGFSAAAFGLVVCLPLAQAQPLSHTPEPRFGDAPAGDATALEAASEADFLAAAEADLAAADSEFANIRKALDVLGPLPDHPGLFIPRFVEAGPLEETPSRDLSQLYAIAPKFDRSASLFHRAELGSFASQQAAERRWQTLAETNRLAGLAPAYAEANGEIRLSAGPLATAGDVEALCVELSALAGPCHGIAPIRAR
jgi:hypothetical protein